MKVLVCGGRDYDDAAKVEYILNRINEKAPITQIINGKARGADSLGRSWGKLRSIEVVDCPAQWDLYGKSAGYIRNKYMLTLQPDLVVAFPGGKGTADMIKQAVKAGVKVDQIVS